MSRATGSEESLSSTSFIVELSDIFPLIFSVADFPASGVTRTLPLQIEPRHISRLTAYRENLSQQATTKE